MSSTRSQIMLTAIVLLSLALTVNADMGRPTTSLNLREHPRRSSRVVRVLRPSETVEVLSRIGKWYQVRDELSGAIGYVSVKYLSVTLDNSSDNRPTYGAIMAPNSMHSVHHSAVRVHRAVLKNIEDFAEKMAASGVTFSAFGEDYEPPAKFIVVFGRGISLSDLRAAIDATGPSPIVYVVPVGSDDFENTIVVGAEGGTGQKLTKLVDIYDALQSAEDVDDFAMFVSQKAQYQP